MKKRPWFLSVTLWIASLGFVGIASAPAATSSPPDPELEAPAPLTGLIVASDSTLENAPANLYVTKPDGTILRYLTRDNNWNRNAGWSYDGTKVVWNLRNSTGGIWVMNANGSQKRELTARPGGAPSHAYGPAFSPDGKHIVYSDYPAGSPGANQLVGIEVYVMNADGTGKRRLTETTVDGVTNTHRVIRWSNLPAYSPDNKKIVFASTQSGNSEIWVMNVDGTRKEQLTFNAHTNGPEGPDANFPSFSPDGKKIAFLCGWETLYGNICLMNADGSDRTQLTHDGDDGLKMDETSNDEPAWSPDGKSIMFDSDRYDRDLGGYAARTWVMNADGSNQRVLLPHMYGEGRNPWIK